MIACPSVSVVEDMLMVVATVVIVVVTVVTIAVLSKTVVVTVVGLCVVTVVALCVGIIVAGFFVAAPQGVGAEAPWIITFMLSPSSVVDFLLARVVGSAVVGLQITLILSFPSGISFGMVVVAGDLVVYLAVQRVLCDMVVGFGATCVVGLCVYFLVDVLVLGSRSGIGDRFVVGCLFVGVGVARTERWLLGVVCGVRWLAVVD